MSLRPDLAAIAANISPGARVLDIGCGDGELLAALRDEKQVDARGMEIDATKVEQCVSRGLSVIQGDANTDLAFYPDATFDFAILSQTLQTTTRPDLMLDELLRIGRRAFVSFPNFAHWRVRMALLCRGRMPVTRALPQTWYDTPNIHHLTIADFHDLLAAKNVKVEGSWYFANGVETGATGANWFAQGAVFLISRQR
jgi:methionine biosynthesis protein MetW